MKTVRKAISRTVALMAVCILVLLSCPGAFADGRIYACELEEKDFINTTLLTKETYPQVCLTNNFPWNYYKENGKEPVFLCFSYPDGALPSEFDHEMASVIDSEKEILYTYYLDKSASFEVFLNNAESDEDILRDGSEGVGTYIEVKPDSRSAYGYGMIKATEFGKSAKLVITVRMYGLKAKISEEERRQMITAAIEEEIERVNSEKQIRTIRPYWSDGRFDGIRMMDYDFTFMTVFDFFPLNVHKKNRYDDWGTVQGELSLTSIDGTRVEGIYNFGDGTFVEFQMELDIYGSIFSRHEKNEEGSGLVKLADGTNWAYWIGNQNDDGSVYGWYAERELDDHTDDHGKPYYLSFHFGVGGGHVVWDNPDACFKTIEELESHLQFINPEDDPYTLPAEMDDETVAATETQTNGIWNCPNCGTENSGKFCSECGSAKPAVEGGPWVCPNCGTENSGKFCSECGNAKPAEEGGPWVCPNCNAENGGKFCTECGSARP